ncbi:MAG: hypothetical protein QF886_10255, partial [Planctomycetota bacterium]|nr:hypothetical protein [Planctomycetota bacterium]
MSITQALHPKLLTEDWKAQEYSMDAGDTGIPTTSWGGPRYAKGKISVLVFLVEPIHHLESRRPIELQRAFDFDVQYVHITDYRQQVDVDRARELLDSKRWDAILLWNDRYWMQLFNWLNDEIKYKVLKQVSEGSGLVITDRPPPDVLRADRSIRPTDPALTAGLALTGRYGRDDLYWKQPEFRRRKPDERAFRSMFFSTYRLGKGLAVNYRAPFSIREERGTRFARSVTWDHRMDPDYALAEMGRAILWASGKHPDVVFHREPPARWIHDWETEGGQKARWVLKVNGYKRKLSINCRLRDLIGNVIARDKKETAVASDEFSHEWELPRLDAGQYYLDIFADSPRGREAYGYSTVEVTSPISIRFNSVPKAVEEGEPIKIGVTVEGHAPGEVDIEADYIDSFDRVLARERKTSANECSFAFPTGPACTLQMRVLCRALVNGREAARVSAPINLLRRRHGRFNVVLWGRASGVWAFYGKRILNRTGVTHLMAHGNEDAEIGTVPFTMTYGFT